MDKKRLFIIADLGVGGERGRIFKGFSIGTISATEYKDPEKVIKKWKRKQ